MSLSFSEALRRVPRGFLGMVALVAACEAFIASNDLKFSRLEAEDWRTSARIARGELPLGGILFFGDSQVKFGVSPLVLEAKLSQPSQCLAVQGGQAPSSYFLLKKTLDAGVLPAAIVVDFEPHLLRDGLEHNKRMWAELATLGECLEMAWTAGDAGAFASMGLGRVLPSYLERYEIRDNIKAALKGETPLMASWLQMAARNKGMNRGALAMTKGIGDPTHDPSRWANPTPTPWAADPVNDAYARKFLALAARYKIPVYCALMPVVPGLQEKYEKYGMDQYYFAWLRQLQEKHANLYILDWRHSNYQPPAFTDAMHLNVEGATAITMALGDYLQKSFRGEGVDVRWVRMPEFKLDATQIAVEDSNRSNAFMQSTAKLRR